MIALTLRDNFILSHLSHISHQWEQALEKEFMKTKTKVFLMFSLSSLIIVISSIVNAIRAWNLESA